MPDGERWNPPEPLPDDGMDEIDDDEPDDDRFGDIPEYEEES